MKTLVNLTYVLALVTTTLLTACTAKVDGSPFDGLGNGNSNLDINSDFKDTVAAPDIQGTWLSECTVSRDDFDKHEIITLSVNDHSVTRKRDVFASATCLQSSFSYAKSEVGVVRYDAITSSGVYQLTYRFTMPNGWYEQLENVQLNGSSLYITNEVGGDANPTVRMTKQ